ncbi:hypothetical protein Tco_1184986 [Tanacetum coccineum]
MAPTSNELLQPWVIRSMEYFGSHDVEHEPVLIDHEIPVEPQFKAGVALERQSEPNVPMFTREELVAEHHAIKERVQIIENLANADPSIYKNESVSEDSVAKHKEFVHKENESANGKMAESAFSCVLIGEVSDAKSVSNEFVLQQLQSCDGKLPESSLSNALNGEFSCDINRPNEHISKNLLKINLNMVMGSEASRDKFVPSYCNGQSSKLYYSDSKEYTSSCMTQLLQVADQPSTQMVVDYSMDLNLPNFNESFTESQKNDNAGFDFDNIENHSLNDMVRTGTKDIHLDELLSENGDQLLNTTDVVEGEKYENGVHVDQSPVEQKCQDLALYLNETYKGKALVEPYTFQPPTTVSVHLGKAIRKRKKKAAKRLQSRKAQILFDDDGDDDHDNTQSNKTCKRKDTIPLSEIAKSEFPLVEYCEDLSNHLTVEEIRSGVITLYDSMGVSVEETREWWSDMRIAFKTRMPHYFRD